MNGLFLCGYGCKAWIWEKVEKSQSKIHCIYGDRGSKRKEAVLDELELAPNIKELIDIEIISNSCHFPMLENSEDLVKILDNILRM